MLEYANMLRRKLTAATMRIDSQDFYARPFLVIYPGRSYFRDFSVIDFDNAALGIIETDRHDRCAAVNKRMCEIVGYTHEELVGMIKNLTAPEDRQLSVLGRGHRIDYEKRYLRRDGFPVWVHVTVTAIRDQVGAYLRCGCLHVRRDFEWRRSNAIGREPLGIVGEVLDGWSRLVSVVSSRYANNADPYMCCAGWVGSRSRTSG